MQKVLKLLLVCVLCLIAAGILYFVVVLSYSSLTEFKPSQHMEIKIQGHGLQSIDTGKNISFLTWNIGYAGLGKEMDFFYEGGKMVRPPEDWNTGYLKGIISFLEQESYRDMILLQEVDFNSKRSYGQNQLEEIKEVLPAHVVTDAVNYQSKYVPVPLYEPMGKVRSGLVTLSKYQPFESLRLPTPGHYSWPKRLFQLKRCFLVNRYHVSDGRELVLIHLHNSAFEDADDQRKAELEMLKDLATREFARGNYVVAGGDWNQNPPGMNAANIHEYKAKEVWPIKDDLFPENWTWAYDPYLPTNRDVNMPFEKERTETTILDFFLLSPNISLVNVTTFDLGFKNSDHLPVGMTMQLKHGEKKN